ncbi:MAG: hypothetical protein BAJALOKI2v1_10025 [Promethearchaeota archaeon]|nr:MAG: hypothetical protein BAJALOKI2v1_10025 [Candidatus Lokiarchaeota archaeon]
MDNSTQKNRKWIKNPHNEILVSLIIVLVFYIINFSIDIHIYNKTIISAVYDNFWEILLFMMIPAGVCFGLKLWHKNSNLNFQNDNNFSKKKVKQ